MQSLSLFVERIRSRNKPPIKLFWWRYEYPDKLNFGDEITPLIIRKLWGRECEWADPTTCELAGAGSIIEMLYRKAEGNQIKIWGSGFMKDGPASEHDNLDFYAVRGYSSLGRINQVREVALGDPGLLMNLVVKPSRAKSHKVGIVYHYVDEDHPALAVIKNNPDYKLINPLQTPEKVAADITSCHLVLSSSLHGLIVADSFGIPNYWMPMSDNVSGGAYKFNDYYSATGRTLTKKPVEILGDSQAVDAAIQSYEKVQNLKALQKGLINSFPFWKN